MSSVIHLDSLPIELREKVRSFGAYDRREGSLVTLLFKDGRRVKNIYVAADEDARREQDCGLDFASVEDVTRQVWLESEAEKPWWDSENREWWKS